MTWRSVQICLSIMLHCERTEVAWQQVHVTTRPPKIGLIADLGRGKTWFPFIEYDRGYKTMNIAKKLCVAAVLSLTGTASVLAAECAYPKKPVDPPSGAKATQEE